jgi:anti-sigma regulatory factor (Ser/Thr protein kinase)
VKVAQVHSWLTGSPLSHGAVRRATRLCGEDEIKFTPHRTGEQATPLGTEMPRGEASADAAATLVAVLPPSLVAPAAARAYLRQWLRAKCTPAQLDVAQLLVSEVVTNAVIHTSPSRIQVSVSWRGSRVQIAVADPSLVQPTYEADAPASATVGRGLLLVDWLAADWGSRPVRDGKEVWFELDFAAPAQ